MIDMLEALLTAPVNEVLQFVNLFIICFAIKSRHVEKPKKNKEIFKK
jgi:hypothetical protein